MFLRMLKNDLKQRKKLNAILLMFMIAACLFLTTAATEIYGIEKGKKITADVINMSDLSAYVFGINGHYDSGEEKFIKWLDKNEDITEYESRRVITINFSDIHSDKSGPVYENYASTHRVMMSAQTRNMNLPYSMDNSPFYIESGNVAIPHDMAEGCGFAVGDTITLSTQKGNMYSFTVCEIYKIPVRQYRPTLFFSEADFEVLASESFEMEKMYEIKSSKPMDVWNEMSTDDFPIVVADYEVYPVAVTNSIRSSGESDTRLVLSYLIFVVSGFMIFIILSSVRFTLKSAVNDEKKEIGMMRAIGADSAGFRMLIAVKYTAFTVTGAVAGLAAGIPAAQYLLKTFSPDIITPDTFSMIMTGAAVMIVFTAFMILYIALNMRMINKISVIDTLHGDNRGERFGKASYLFLHRCRKMPSELFLALTDILKGFRRYIFLITVYTLCTLIMLLGLHLDTTLHSEKYLRYALYNTCDFGINLNSSTVSKVYKKTYSWNETISEINRTLNRNGIPAEIEFLNCCDVYIHDGETSRADASVLWGDYDTRSFRYRKGGTAPLLKNEAALNYQAARKYGYSIGDTVTIEYFIPEYGDNGMLTETADFIITGFYDCMSGDWREFILGNEFEGAADGGITIVSCSIDGNRREKAEYLQMMKNLYSSDSFKSTDDVIYQNFGHMFPVVTAMKYIFLTVCSLVMVLFTLMNYEVLMQEDISSAALLVNSGAGVSSLRKWILFRFGILVVFSFLAGFLLTETAGQALCCYLFDISGITGVRLTESPFRTFIAVPLITAGAVLLPVLVSMKNIGKINIRSMNPD